MLADQSITQRMSRRGNCFDNAVSESFFATLKKELVHRLRIATPAEVSSVNLEYIEVSYHRWNKMKVVCWAFMALVVGCSSDTRSDGASPGLPCGPIAWNESIQYNVLGHAIGTVRALRQGDSIAPARFMRVVVADHHVLAWYRVVDVARTQDSIDYAFVAIRFRGIPLYESDDSEDLTPDKLDARQRSYFALCYLVRRGKSSFMSLYRNEYDYDVNDHALAYDSPPTLREVYQVLQRWASPHVRPADDVSDTVSGFAHPLAGELTLIADQSTAPAPFELRPVPVVAGQVCDDAWRRFLGSAPNVWSTVPR